MKQIHIILFGIGNVGSTLLNQLLNEQAKIRNNYQLELIIPIIINSTTAFFKQSGISTGWETDFYRAGIPYKLSDIIRFLQQQKWKNLVAIDATASTEFVNHYEYLIKNGLHIITANKVANTKPQDFYNQLRKKFQQYNKKFYYETNVGAGLPVVETINRLHYSGEQVNRIRGVFSGSLSYLFNSFSVEDKCFSEILEQAEQKGYTEPDPRIDLSGTDVARKLLILARELQLEANLEDIQVESLVPPALNGSTSLKEFQQHKKIIDDGFQKLKKELNPDEVLRYIGELDVTKKQLHVKLIKARKDSPLGSLKGADSLFEIYTESYGEQPIVIQGAGAGAAVTARGIFTDLLKLSERIH